MRIKGRDRKYSLRTIIDTGSQNSFISRYAAKALRNHELKAEETMNYFTNTVKQNEDSSYHRLNIYTDCSLSNFPVAPLFSTGKPKNYTADF